MSSTDLLGFLKILVLEMKIIGMAVEVCIKLSVDVTVKFFHTGVYWSGEEFSGFCCKTTTSEKDSLSEPPYFMGRKIRQH